VAFLKPGSKTTRTCKVALNVEENENIIITTLKER